MKKYFIASNNGEVESLIDSLKEAKRELKRIVYKEARKFGEASFKDYSIRTLEYNSKKYKADLRFNGELIVSDKNDNPIDYDIRSSLGIKDIELKKDFLYL